MKRCVELLAKCGQKYVENVAKSFHGPFSQNHHFLLQRAWSGVAGVPGTARKVSQNISGLSESIMDKSPRIPHIS